MSETVIDGLPEQGGVEVGSGTIPDRPGSFRDRDSLNGTYVLKEIQTAGVQKGVYKPRQTPTTAPPDTRDPAVTL